MSMSRLRDLLFTTKRWGQLLTTVTTLLAVFYFPLASAVNLTVLSSSGVPITGFHWTLEEDNTAQVTKGIPGDLNMLSLGFHASHAPVLASGTATSATVDIPLPVLVSGDDRYFISITPFVDHNMSGIAVNSADTAVTLTVNSLPIPTAQISIFAFHDNKPINNVPDLPGELGLPNFDVILIDAAGLYGIAGGQVIQDAFGNPLGTTYVRDASGIPVDLNGDGDWDIDVEGSGVMRTDKDGVLLIKNLAPGKYGIQVVPPAGLDWHQTSTIEGSKTIDAWVAANEPSFFKEFGPPGHHVFVGFVKTNTAGLNPLGVPMLTGSASISGRVVNQHNSRPPEFLFFPGDPIANCWVGLNSLAVGIGESIYSAPCDANSHFSIPNVPDGNYQLVVWDAALLNIIALRGVTITGGVSKNMGDVPIFAWNGRLFNTVFFDANNNGFMDANEQGIPEQAVLLRFRNGAVYRNMPTDFSGESPFEEVFPFFSWLVAEVDFGRFKATGVTYMVDAGGAVTAEGQGMAAAQPQDIAHVDINGVESASNPNTGNNHFKTIEGPVLTLGFQQFLGQTSFINWGKAPYSRGENGGISGIVYNATTRAEVNPRFAAAEEWETGIPRVQISLYADANADGVIDTLNIDPVSGLPLPILADVDNYPLGNFPGSEDNDRNGNGIFDQGDALQVTYSDSWDDSAPTGCQGTPYIPFEAAGNTTPIDCYDGLRVFNQIRDAVFDGGYAFGDVVAGDYIVETAVPSGYELLKEEDKNVDFGVTFVPQLLAAECVGDLHIVPDSLSFQTHTDPVTGLAVSHVDPADLIAAPMAGQSVPFCDKKKVHLADRTNAAADFFLFTQSPIASRAVGFMLNDLANEFDPNAPTFGEKFAPSWLPVSFRDWSGREIARVYSDEFGKYNALLPSTFTMNLPLPSGAMANMITACMNDAGPIPHPDDPDQFITDPNFNRQFTQFCYTLQFMPGTTTYLDTPVLPIAAFAGGGSFPADCEAEFGIPKISRVDGPTGLPGQNGGPYAEFENPDGSIQSIVIKSALSVPVPNPAFGAPGEPKSVSRDYGFGNNVGVVTVTGRENGEVFLVPTANITSWTNASITFRVPADLEGITGQLNITRRNNDGTIGKSTENGLTLTIGKSGDAAGGNGPIYVSRTDGMADYDSIQGAIDATSTPEGALILIEPGVYTELVIMWKPVKLQGYGSASTIISAVKAPASKLAAWRKKIVALYTGDDPATPPGVRAFNLLPGQQYDPNVNPANNEPGIFNTEEGAGITVVGNVAGSFNEGNAARIDGLQITGADQGGAIFVNGYADFLQISNNRLVANHGIYGGGIRVGDPLLQSNGTIYNNAIQIYFNEIIQNGASRGAGGGVSMYAGSDNYLIVSNQICGNFSNAQGGGIGHQGQSNNGLIAQNTILFNQNFSQMTSVSGGGIYIAGNTLAAGELTDGSGNVFIDRNLIQGNNAGSGDGGGIRLELINGQDVLDGEEMWHTIGITNNIIVNNVAGLAGGGISLQDALQVDIVNNTIVNNDSTATSGEAFAPNNPNQSTAQVAGIVSRAHTVILNAEIKPGDKKFDKFRDFSNPTLANNIIWHNRSFFFLIDPNDTTSFSLIPNITAGDAPVYDDLGVLGFATGIMSPINSILSAGSPELGNPAVTGNSAVDPEFVYPYVNSDRNSTIAIPEATVGLGVAIAFDEGGNSIDVHYGPLTLDGGNGTDRPANDGNLESNYHLLITSPAIDGGALFVKGQALSRVVIYKDIADKDVEALILDIDGDPRPFRPGTKADIGADEVD